MKIFGVVFSLFALLVTTASARAGESSFSEVCRTRAQQVKEKIAKAQDCSSDEDCVSTWLGCPFGCGTAVARGREQEIKKEVLEYNTRCQRCAYRCVAGERKTRCRDDRCIIEIVPPSTQ